MNTERSIFIGDWVNQMVAHCQPAHVHWCDGTETERIALTKLAVEQGILFPLDQQKRPGCYYHRSNPNDVARVEQCTFICTPEREEAGPTNNWADPTEMRNKLMGMAEGAMRGRTMYVVPYLMGIPGSPMSQVGVELTDSLYVVLSMRIMTRMGNVALLEPGDPADFNRGLHCMLDLHPDRRFIAHFPQDNVIISLGSNYGGNVLLGKKCLALRIGSYLGHKQGWLAEHMLILGVESPAGEKTFVAAAFPSACGKTNFAMMIPPTHFSGWKVWTIGDDIAWMKPGSDGRLYAVNPEAGYFGVVPGTNSKSNPNAMACMERDTIFTNVALTPDGDVWWEGKDGPPPAECLDWRGNKWTPDSKEKAAHPNSRFTAPMDNNPMLAAEARNPSGVPIDAIIFGGRRSDTVPVIYQAFDWDHGVYMGATMGSETTAAAVGSQGVVRRDPMAMLPFCGYNMGRYFQSWLRIRQALARPPQIFHVNWFRRDADGNYFWPGYGENIRVLQWIVDRCHERAAAAKSVLGWVPDHNQLDFGGLPNFTPARFDAAQEINIEEWRRELAIREEFFEKLHPDLPGELVHHHQLLRSRLDEAAVAAV